MRQSWLLICLIGLVFSCSENITDDPSMFELKNNSAIGIDFENNLDYTNDFNVYKYRNFYNGGGVSLGDINNDGLVDIYMISNQQSNRLFLNKGNWQFEDISEKAGIGGGKAWSTGVTMVDINADGLLDIYVCNSGDVKGDNKENELFINNGDLTFTEAAVKYNLNDKGFSTHASFFDYDKDGDLDAYILNNSFQAIGSFNLRKNERPVRDELGGDKLMKNEGGKYIDVSEQAGIYGSVIGFGLGITIGDVNNDNWEDIFISNDFFERDYLYINQKDGTFKEDLVNQIPSISGASMGADIGDINNDGYNEIFVTEMLPSDYERLKSVTTFENWDRYQYNVKNGYHHQFTHNFLHLNNGDDTFSDISRFAGVEASDWSWGALFFDMDNDGLKDLFIANGIYRDLTDQDYLQYISNEVVMASIIKEDGVNYKELIEIIPSNKITNHAYRNKGDLSFGKFENSGLETPAFSNGSAFGDLDNDGDLDLVVNNVNMPSFFYENNQNKKGGNNYIKLNLKGAGTNTFAIGAKILVSAGEQSWMYENQPARGFQSSMDTRPNIGVGTAEKVNLKIIWPSGKVTSKENITVNQMLTLAEKDATGQVEEPESNVPSLFQPQIDVLNYQHQENKFVDFNRNAMDNYMLSTRGPCVSYADVNGDKLKDLIIPGPKGSTTKVLLQNTNGKFTEQQSDAIFTKLKAAENIKCDLFDADNDGDLDLYLASGGTELTKFSELLFDELLINDGTGKFTSSQQKLPNSKDKISTGAIAHSDIDGDGDLDLFVGERVKITAYGGLCSGYILINDGQGKYQDQTTEIAAELKNIGLVTDAIFTDLDKDGDEDLIVAGEFMPISIFKNEGGKLSKVNSANDVNGWWNVVKTVDIDNDGDLDIIAGNHGLNSRFRASKEHPIRMYFNDFDKNGFPEGILTLNRADGEDYPYALRHKLTKRMPVLNKKYPDFKTFKNATIQDIFGPEGIQEATISEIVELQTVIFINEGNLVFKKRNLPASVQFSPVFAIAHTDLNQDGFQDLVLGGNLYNVQPEIGRYDASYGHVLINDGKGNFTDQSGSLGFSIKGEIRDFVIDDDKLMVFRNNDSALVFKINIPNG